MTGWRGFEALAPFFRIIDEGLSGLVDGEHFFDTLAEDAVFEYVISVPGYPKITRWRDYLDPVAVLDAVGWPAHHK